MLLALISAAFVYTQGRAQFGPDPSRLVARLNGLVQLTPLQQIEAKNIFGQECKALLSLSATDRPASGAAIRQSANAQIRAILTTQQLELYNITPVSAGGGCTINPSVLVSNLDSAFNLSDDQVQAIAKIYLQEIADLNTLSQSSPSVVAAFRQNAISAIRAQLDPSQQAQFDRNPKAMPDLDVRSYVMTQLRNSNALIGIVGQITKIEFAADPTIVTTDSDSSQRGQYQFNVTGTLATTKVKVSWSRISPGDSIQIINASAASGAGLALH